MPPLLSALPSSLLHTKLVSQSVSLLASRNLHPTPQQSPMLDFTVRVTDTGLESPEEKRARKTHVQHTCFCPNNTKYCNNHKT